MAGWSLRPLGARVAAPHGHAVSVRKAGTSAPHVPAFNNVAGKVLPNHLLGGGHRQVHAIHSNISPLAEQDVFGMLGSAAKNFEDMLMQAAAGVPQAIQDASSLLFIDGSEAASRPRQKERTLLADSDGREVDDLAEPRTTSSLLAPNSRA